MIQVLPAVEGFGSQLAQSLGSAVGGIGSKALQNKYDTQIFGELSNNPNLTPMQTISLIGKLSPQSQAAVAPLATEFLKGKIQGEKLNKINEMDAKLLYGTSGLPANNEANVQPPNISPSQQSNLPENQTQMPLNVTPVQEQQETDFEAIPSNKLRLVAGRGGTLAEAAKQELKRGVEAEKANSKYITGLLNSVKSSQDTIARLDRIAALNKTKDRQKVTPALAAILDKVGAPIGVLKNASAEEFEKLSQDLLKGLPQTYGTRILQIEVQNFLKTIPTLLNTPEGVERIVNNMKMLLELPGLEHDSLKEIRSIYKDRLPSGLQEKVLEKYLGKVENWQQKFAEVNKDFDEQAQANQIFVPKAAYQGELLKPETARMILQKAGGDRMKATQLAKELGYSG